MRKLIILKSLIDFIWIVVCIPLIPLLLFFTVYMFIDASVLNIVYMKLNTIPEKANIYTQLFALLIIAVVYIEIYSFYLFRKTLRYFQKVQPFHQQVILNFNRVGKLLVFSGIVGIVIVFANQLVLQHKSFFGFGLSPYLVALCLGLFFMVLSEVFKVAKHAKEENELTV